MSPVSKNLKGHTSKISSEDRADLLGQQGVVVWLTGLSGSGKSTLAYELERRLIEGGRLAYTLDGDNVRQGLCRDLGFSPDDRHENLRRIGEVAALFADAGVIVITAFISPYRSDRDRAREIAKDRFLEIYLDVPIEVCEKRDPKGLYKRARAGEIQQFTGVSAPYEAPENPELALDTDAHEPGQNVEQIIELLSKRGVIREKPTR